MPPESNLSGSLTNLPTIQRFDAGDYKEAPSWFTQKFFQALNLFVQPTYNILNSGVQIMSNTAQEIYTFTLTAGAAATNNTFAFTPRKFVGKPNGVILGQCYNTTAGVPTAIGNPVTFDWYWDGAQVKILAIYGLTSTVQYSFNLYIY